jgi:2-oxoglutarate dehydrogenase E2 component (dihydrolipoamide succinyltransferase)
MLVDIVMPKMGESIMEGTILKWLKKPGEKIERDEPLLEISTDKVDTEVPAPETGIISELLFKEGDIVEVGKVLARMDTDSNGVVEPVNKVAEEKIIAEPVKTDTLINKAEPVKADTLINKAEPVKRS